MFKNTYQSGLLSIFYSCGSNPLGIWDMEVNNGHIKRLTDPDVSSIVLEIVSTNVATTYISCPRNNQVLGIKLPFLVMIVKNLKRYFSFEITVLDDKNMRRRFRISNFQSTTKIKPFCTSMPIGLSGGWNQIQFNLADFTKRAYGSAYIEALRVQIHANTRLRRIYFSDRLYTEEELPQEYKLYLPMEKKLKKAKEVKKDTTADAAKGDAPKKQMSTILEPDHKEADAAVSPAVTNAGDAAVSPAVEEEKPEDTPTTEDKTTTPKAEDETVQTTAEEATPAETADVPDTEEKTEPEAETPAEEGAATE